MAKDKDNSMLRKELNVQPHTQGPIHLKQIGNSRDMGQVVPNSVHGEHRVF